MLYPLMAKRLGAQGKEAMQQAAAEHAQIERDLITALEQRKARRRPLCMLCMPPPHPWAPSLGPPACAPSGPGQLRPASLGFGLAVAPRGRGLLGWAGCGRLGCSRSLAQLSGPDALPEAPACCSLAARSWRPR